MEWEASGCASPNDSSSSNGPYKATQMWQELVQQFRKGMPRQRRKVRRRCSEECFSGGEAVEWMHSYLQSSGRYGAVSRQQAVTLLEKFFQSDVIREVQGKKQYQFSEDGSCWYSFVTEPGPFNFVEKVKDGEENPTSPLGKRGRGGKKGKERKDEEGTCFVNEYAVGGSEKVEGKGLESRRKSARLSMMDTNSSSISSCSTMTQISPTKVAEVWKELTLARLLCLVEMPSLDEVLSHSTVSGKHIEQNAAGSQMVQSIFRSSRRSRHCHTAQSLAQDVQEASGDFPSWVTAMMTSLAKWPEGCPADVVSGRPHMEGGEREVLQSVVHYLHTLPEPLISTNLYTLHMAVYSLLRAGKPTAVDALQLCLLLLPQNNRIRVQRALHTIDKASHNSRLHLSPTHSNRDVMVSTLALSILCPGGCSMSCSELEQTDIHNLVWFMSQQCSHIFKVPVDLRQDVHRRLTAHIQGKDSPGTCCVAKTFCQRVSPTEYKAQVQSFSQQSITSLLDRIATDENMSEKERKRKLKIFQQQYPDIYSRRFGSQTPQPRHNSRPWQFHSLRRRNKTVPR